MKKISFNQLMYGISVVLLVFIFYSLIDKFFLKESKRPIDLDQVVTTHENDIVFGDQNSPKSVYVYFSYKCGYCKRFFREVFPQLKTNYIDKGKLKLVLKLVEASEDVDMLYALQVAVGVNKFGQVEKFHELLLHDSRVVYTDEFKDLCDDFVRANSDIAECVLGGNANEYLKSNYQEYVDLNLTGTPSFIFNQQLYKGYMEYSEFENILKN